MSSLDDDPEATAIATNQRVVLPGPREVFVDLDTAADLDIMDWGVRLLNREGYPCAVTDIHASKSGMPHRHATVTFERDLSPVERIGLQACLGSDRKREILSLLRVWSGTKRPPTCFFEPITTPENT